MFIPTIRRTAAALIGALLLALPGVASAEPPPADVKALLKSEPINKDNWSKWRPRLRDWSGEYYEASEPAFKEGFAFAKSKHDAKGWPKELNKKEDTSVLWMLLGGQTLFDTARPPVERAREAEKQLTDSIKADKNIARAHYWKSLALRQMELTPVNEGGPAKPDGGRLKAALTEMEEARTLDPKLKGITNGDLGELAVLAGQHEKADTYLTAALNESPDVKWAHVLAKSANERGGRPNRSALIQPLLAKFPKDPALTARYAIALAQDGKLDEAVKELDAARKLKADLAAIGRADDIKKIDEHGSKNPEPLLAQKWKDNPTDLKAAQEYARAVGSRQWPNNRDPQSPVIEPLVKQFPKDGVLRSWYALALDHDKHADEAVRELDEARKLKTDPATVIPKDTVARLDDHVARNADKYVPQKFKETPTVDLARKYAKLLNQGKVPGVDVKAPYFKKELDKFLSDPEVRTRYAIALWQDRRPDDAVKEFEAVGKTADPRTLVSADDLKPIVEYRNEKHKKAAEAERARRQEDERQATLNAPLEFFKTVGWWALWFSIVYGIIMGLMCLGGVWLAKKTTGTHAMDLLDAPPEKLVEPGGHVVMATHESKLKRFYLAALLTALVLFYLSLPFVFLGLLIVFLTLMVAGWLTRNRRGRSDEVSDMKNAASGGMKAVFKCMFASTNNFHFGVRKEREDCPKLFAAVEEVAKRVDTEPVDELWISPGADFYVMQAGRGPFGVFGGRKRVLMLGMCVMHYLSISELKAILAHEYAHFSHADTFWSRFLYQVTLSLNVAMREMGRTGGWVTYVNPFYWFFYLYNRSYAMLSAGFSRSREYLADRMACGLYGSDVFTRGLIKVCTDGSLFEGTVYHNIVKLLKQKKAFVNMYKAFREFRDKAYTDDERRKKYKKLLDDKPSLYASHPTFGERLAAAKTLPTAKQNDQTSSLQLFEKPEEMEKEMTDWLTEIVNHVIK